MKYTITDTNLHIEDSYTVSKRMMDLHLDVIRQWHPDSNVWKRSMFSLQMEWCVHNALYGLGLWRSHTKDVDLDYPCNKPEWVYEVLGCLVWLFVK